MFAELGHEHGARPVRGHCSGEIDYLLGDHASARAELGTPRSASRAVGDRLGRAQCLVVQSLGRAGRRRDCARDRAGAHARGEFDAIGYRLGLAQCDITLAHAEHRGGRLDRARTIALAARSPHSATSGTRAGRRRVSACSR
jgi:hypothetical protein